MYGHVGHHVLHEEEKIGGEILICPMIQRKNNSFYIVHCTWSTWKSTQKHCGREESALNLSQKIRCGVFLFYQAHQAKRKQGRRLRAGENKTTKRKFVTKYCSALQRRNLTGGTTELVENCDRSQFIGYSQLIQYLCACLKLLKKQRYVGQSVISFDKIKSERDCMIMKMVQSRKVKDIKST